MALLQNSTRRNGIVLFCKLGTAGNGSGTLLQESGLLRCFVNFLLPFSVGAEKQIRPCSQQLGSLKYCARVTANLRLGGVRTVLLEAM